MKKRNTEKFTQYLDLLIERLETDKYDNEKPILESCSIEIGPIDLSNWLYRRAVKTEDGWFWEDVGLLGEIIGEDK